MHQSRITCLEVAADGEALVTGCAAAAPRLKEGPDFPAATISTKVTQQGRGQWHHVRIVLTCTCNPGSKGALS